MQISADHQKTDYRAVRRVLWAVLIANLAVTTVKIVLGLLTGALSVVADGFHSLVDSSSNLIGLAAIRLAARPADEQHPYGYARYETIGSLAIGGLLLAAAWEIGSAIVERLSGGAPPEVNLLMFVLVTMTFPVNVLIVLLETRFGKKLNSEILLADATHTRTDLFVTGSVMASLVAIQLGWTWLDPLVAAGVVVLILRSAFQILKDTASLLTDATMLDSARVEEIAQSVEGVWYVHRVRSRGAPSAVFVDLHAKVYPGMSTDQSHALASEVERRIKAEYPVVTDVLVHVEPGMLDPKQLRDLSREQLEWQRISYDLRQIADSMNLGVHDIHITQVEDGGYSIELHLEIRDVASLKSAHQLADEYEQRTRQNWPQVRSIITHLEPLPSEVLQTRDDNYDILREEVFNYLSAHYGGENVLEIQARKLDGHASIAIRLGMSGLLTLDQAHDLAEEIERTLIGKINGLERVTVHVEPFREE